MRRFLFLFGFAALFLGCSSDKEPVGPNVNNGTGAEAQTQEDEISEEDRELIEQLGY